MGTITMIAAAAENNAIGKDNDLLWHLPDDFKRFKELTSGHPIIMGRRTFESFPKTLPNRRHIIITRDKNYTTEYADCVIVHSLEEAFDSLGENEDSYIIGGGDIYTLAMPYSDVIELTRVHHTFQADAFFPEINENDWEIVREESHPKDDKHAFEFTYLTYHRRKN